MGKQIEMMKDHADTLPYLFWQQMLRSSPFTAATRGNVPLRA